MWLNVEAGFVSEFLKAAVAIIEYSIDRPGSSKEVGGVVEKINQYIQIKKGFFKKRAEGDLQGNSSKRLRCL